MPFADENQGRRRLMGLLLARIPAGGRRALVVWGGIGGILLLAFLAGAHYGQRQTASGDAAGGGPKILYYVDPMNPAHTSPEPGLAPCGMKMEPVYADDEPPTGSGHLKAGTLKISPQKQQLIGVRLIPV